MRYSEIILSLGVVAVATSGVAAQTSSDRTAVRPAAVTRIDGPVVLDGRPDESVWQGVAPLPMTMYQPVHRGAMTERTEIRVAYDDEYLYVAGRFFDDDPSGIRVNSMYRDRTRGDDVFGIVIDPFNDNDIGLWLWTTPAGIRGDAEITGDGQGTNSDWNTYWDVATTITSGGWFAEMRVPFSSLGFQVTGDRVEIGLSAYRYIARKNERQVFPDIGPEFNYLRPSLASDMEMTGIRAARPAYVTPYVMSGVGQDNQLPVGASSYDRDTRVQREVGLDLKYNLTSRMTLDVTVNTDFAQVEADDQQVNLTRYPLFFPEKRQFFQERSGVFNFSTGGSSRLFHSRRIGIRDGAPVRILGGARVVGRLGDWDVGALTMQTGRSGASPSENFGVMRLRRRVFNEHSQAGMMVTSRVDEDGRYNVAYGLDGSFRLFADNYLTVQWAQSVDQALVDSLGFRALDAGRVRIAWNRANNRGLTYFFSGRWSGPDYQPGLGFVSRRDFTDFNYYLAYFHYPTSGPFRRLDPFQLFGNVVIRNEDGTVESMFAEHDFDLQWKSGASLGIDLELYYDDLRQPLGLPGDATVPEGRYWFPRFEFSYNMAPADLVRVSFGGGVQQFYDGWLANVRAGPRWTVSRHLGVNLNYGLNVARFPDRNEGFDSHLLRLRVEGAVNTRISVNTFLQVSNSSHLAAANVRLRYNFREGNDLWLVYNEGWNLDRDRLSPRLPRTDNRTLVMKYSHTFRQ